MALALRSLNSEEYPAERFPLTGVARTWRVGRDSTCDLQLSQTSVSSLHAKILANGDGIEVVDCDSRNGTFVNGVRVDRCRIEEGDHIGFSLVEFVVETLPSPGGEEEELKATRRVDALAVLLRGLEREKAAAAGEGEVRGESGAERSGPEPGNADAEKGAEAGGEGFAANAGPMGAEVGAEVGADEGNDEKKDGGEDGGELLELRLKIQALEEERGALLARIGQFEGEQQDWQSRIRDLGGELATRKEEIGALGKEREALREEAGIREGILRELERALGKNREEIGKLGRETENLRQEIGKGESRIEDMESRLGAAEGDLGEARKRLEERLSEIGRLEEGIRERDETLRQLNRQLEEAGLREERLSQLLKEARHEVLIREGEVATLRYEGRRKAEECEATEGERARLEMFCEEYRDRLEKTEEKLRGLTRELEVERTARFEANSRATAEIQRGAELGRRLLRDWKAWLPAPESEIDESDPEAVHGRVNELAGAIREQLDRIEPIWSRFGEAVQGELSDRCDEIRRDLFDLSETRMRRREEIATLEADLARLREAVDGEVRRAQRLSRKGVEVEIPERFETMVIPRDRELEVGGALIDRIADLDQLLGDLPRTRKFAALRDRFAEFRGKLHAILENGGIEAFEVSKGMVLAPAHRGEVRILARKGWGVRQYAELPFQPGEVEEVVSPGYRLGRGETATVLRKVAVRIRGGEE